MSYHLHITSVAERDISQAADYIEFVLKNPKAADDLLEETDQKINALLPFPQEHPIVEDKLLAAWGVTVPVGTVMLIELLLVPLVFVGFVAVKIIRNIGNLGKGHQ